MLSASVSPLRIIFFIASSSEHVSSSSKESFNVFQLIPEKILSFAVVITVREDKLILFFPHTSDALSSFSAAISYNFEISIQKRPFIKYLIN